MTRTKASTPRTIGLPRLADGGERDSEENREDHDRQDLVGAHRLEDRLRHEVRDEILEVERGGLDAARGGGGRDRQVEPDAGMKRSHEDQPERQRHQTREDEPADRTQADAAERGDVAHVRDSGDQRREDERRDDHLDQPQEQGGDDAEVIGDGLQPLGARRRAVVDRVVRRPAGDDPEHQRDQDELRQSFGHAVPFVRPTQAARSIAVKRFTVGDRLG